jgi:hypothetical protein
MRLASDGSARRAPEGSGDPAASFAGEPERPFRGFGCLGRRTAVLGRLRAFLGGDLSFAFGQEGAVEGAPTGAEALLPRARHGWPSLAHISVSFPVDIQSLLPAVRSVAPSY